MLIELEKRFQLPLISYFQWLSGTSTGSIIATSFALRRNLRDIRNLYFQYKDHVLSGSKPYASNYLEKLLKQEFGEDRRMEEIKSEFGKNLIITGTLANRKPSELHLFRSYPSPREIFPGQVPLDSLPTSGRLFPALPTCREQLCWEAIRASGLIDLESDSVSYNPIFRSRCSTDILQSLRTVLGWRNDC